MFDEGPARIRPDNHLRSGAATIVGTMPGTDAVGVAEAVVAATPHLPAAPELLDRRPGSSLVGRLHTALGWAPEGPEPARRVAAAAGLDPEMTLVTCVDEDLDAGLIALVSLLGGDAERTVKVQTVGPVTARLQLERLGIERSVARRLAVRFARERAISLVEWMTDQQPLTMPLVTFDEPGLVTLAGSEPEVDVVEAVDDLVAVVSTVQGLALSGVHCCGPTDWSSVFQAGVDVVNAPIGAGVEAVPGALNSFLVRNGWMCWGVVATRRPIGPQGDVSWKRLTDHWCGLVREGVNPLRLRTQALVSPDCGLAGYGESQAAHVLDVIARIGERVHEQVVAVRFAAGA